MSTSDQQGPTLTRKQLREASFTGSTAVATEERNEAPVDTPPPVVPQPVAPLPRAADPIVVPPAASAESVDLGASPITRRQAREQERVRTGTFPVQDEAQEASAEPIAPAPTAVAVPDPAPMVTGVPPVSSAAPAAPAAGVTFESPAWDTIARPSESSLAAVFGAPAEEPAPIDVPAFDVATSFPVEVAPVVPKAQQSWVADAAPQVRPTVNASFGEALLAPAEGTAGKSAASFDDLLATDSDTTGSQHAAPSALIFSQTPGLGGLSGPVASTGEILVTGTMNLPEGLGSRGHALGAAQGKEVDAVLLDRELAPSSSPTPIAASAAISTIKPAGEVIRPPEPDKGNKVMLALTITAGALALALVGALVVAFTSGVFS